MPDAVVIGAGPNGLVAANHLLDAGWSVHVLEAEPEPGGAVKSAELVEPGFVNDVFSAFYPLAAASPAIRSLDLEAWGLRWRHGPLALAHPSRDGSCVALSRDLEETCASLDSFARGDGDAWRELYALWERIRPGVFAGMVTPTPPVRATARLAATLGPTGVVELARLALQPVRRLAGERFAGAGAARLFAGNALHADLTPESTLSGFFGFLLVALGQDVGFPFPEGGAGRLADAMVRRMRAGGGELTCGARVERVLVRRGRAVGVRTVDGTEVEARRAVLADVDAPSLFLRLVGEEHLPARVLRAIRRFQWDWPTFKVDWTLDGRIPWAAEQARRASVLHLADSIDDLSTWSSALAAGRMPERPFLLFGQYALADETRSPVGKDTAWSYTHVPHGESWDEQRKAALADRIEEVVESYAPGFRSLVRGRHVMAPPDLEARNSNLVRGSLNGGTAQLHQQLVFRPIPGVGRPETPVSRLYLASASAHPGGGVHGGPGAIAARAALNAERARRGVLIAGAAAALAVARRP